MNDYIKREDAIFVALQQPLYSVVSQIKQLEGIDIVRCKECASYCGDGNKCLWGLLTVDMGYCHHGYRGGDCITKQTEQTEREGE